VSRLAGCAALSVLLLGWLSGAAAAHPAGTSARLPLIGPAPDFVLTDVDGARLGLADLRGKVLAITFIYATCTDTCPVLTAKMARLQRRLGRDFGPRVRFVSITVDPEADTTEALRRYAEAHGADPAGWSFLTGTTKEIRDVVRRYGVYARKVAPADVDHTFLTSLVDRTGTLRVQYLGVRFDPEEMLRDLRALLREKATR
jgi:protein SCO1/2